MLVGKTWEERDDEENELRKRQHKYMSAREPLLEEIEQLKGKLTAANARAEAAKKALGNAARELNADMPRIAATLQSRDEPVAWQITNSGGSGLHFEETRFYDNRQAAIEMLASFKDSQMNFLPEGRKKYEITALYATPPRKP